MSTKQINVHFNYQNQYTKDITETSPGPIQLTNLYQSYNRQSKYYQPQTFKSLKIQSKEQVELLNSSPVINPVQKVIKKKYDIPQVCQSLHEQEQLIDQPKYQSKNNNEVPVLMGQKQSLQGYKKSKDQNKQYEIIELPQQKQSEFKGCCGLKTTNDKVAYQSKNQDSIKKTQSNLLNTNKNSERPAQLMAQNKKQPQIKTLNKARGSVKTFVIQNLPQQKQSDFVGCCGFGSSKKVSYDAK